MITLKEHEKIGRFTVQYFIKEGLYNGTYRVADEKGNPYFMKFYDNACVPDKLIHGSEIEEIMNSRKIRHDNVISYVDDGIVKIEGKEYAYLITNYFIGPLLSESLNSGTTFPPETAKEIMTGVVNGLQYLNVSLRLSHNDITPRNIILDEVERGKYVPRIIDLGHLHTPVAGSSPFPVNDLTLQYCAPEALSSFFGPKGDVFAACAVFYHMLTGQTPWPCEISESESLFNQKAKVRQARKSPLDTDLLNKSGASDDIIAIITKGLTLDEEKRPDITDISRWLGGEPVPESKEEGTASVASAGRPEGIGRSGAPQEPGAAVSVQFKKNQEEKGGGFADVAGMDKLKDELLKRVIWVLRDKEKAEKYKLTPPNGMILYGPPGCGKTFFAEKFAEESHFNFSLVNGSDIGSSYIHGTQGKIAALFQEAQKNAPSIICFDEFDSFVPSRSSMAAEHRPEEVNEFLSQLNNCAKRGIFVIGTTNRIDMIDQAVLRKGRMDLHVEIPAPDMETRISIFKIHLKDRPVANDINYDEIGNATDNYASSDIAFIVNEAAMTAALADCEISQQHLMNSIKCNPSSLGRPEVERKRIGY